MLEENHHYGHSTVLREYIGSEDKRSFLARVQHGWQPGLGIDHFRRDDVIPHMVWNGRNLSLCQSVGVKNCTAIGAPFLYLDDSETALDAPEPMSLLAVPFHGWEKEPVNAGFQRYAESLERLQSDGFGPITVCLYWLEYEDEAMRACFTDRGFKVTSLGHRDNNPDFLVKQRDLLLNHSYVTSNRISTAAFYALFLHRKFFLHGPFVEVGDSNSSMPFLEWQKQHFKALEYGQFGDRTYTSIGGRELGVEYKRSPEALRELLGLEDGYQARKKRMMRKQALVESWRLIRGGRARIKRQVDAALAIAEIDAATS